MQGDSSTHDAVDTTHNTESSPPVPSSPFPSSHRVRGEMTCETGASIACTKPTFFGGANECHSQGISLVLPAWNEQPVIVQAITDAVEAFETLACEYEIIVVDDGSTDQTAKLVQQMAERNTRIRLIRHEKNRGYGAALRTGFQAAAMPLVSFTDADCQFDLTELRRLIVLSDDYPIVCGYRMDRKDAWLRCFYSRGYNLIVRTLLGIGVRDVDCALKVFHRSALRELEITTDGFLVNSELLTQAKQKGYSIVEVGVSHRPRLAGESTVSVTHIPAVLSSLVRYWWNSVQFPAVAKVADDRAAPETKRWVWYQRALLILAALFLFLNLGYPLIDRDETRYAEIPREMLVTGDWLVPHLNFEPYYDKPPLVYWLCGLSYRLFGVSEISARLIPAIAAWVTLAMTLWFATRWFGSRTGLYAGGVLMLSAGFVFCSRYLLLDGVLTTLIAAAMLMSFEAVRGDRLRYRWWLASGLFCGLAFLVKGPIALVLCLPPILAFTWLSDSHAKLRIRDVIAFLGVVSCIVAPWIALVAMQDPNYLYEFFVVHNLQRFAGQMHVRPIWYFIPVILVAAHPWSTLAIPIARFFTTRRDEARLRRSPALGFLLICCSWTFLFFSLSKCKLPTYILPVAPALALIIGAYLNVALHDPQARFYRLARHTSAKLATIVTSVAALGLLVFVLTLQPSVSFIVFGWAMLWTSILVGSLVLIGDRISWMPAWKSSAVVSALFALMVMHHLVPAYSRAQSLFDPSSPLAHTPLGESSIATVAHEFSDVPFYLGRNDVIHLPMLQSVSDWQSLFQSHKDAIVFVHRRVTEEGLQEALPIGAAVRLIGQRGSSLVYRVTAHDRLAKRDETSERVPVTAARR